MFNRLSLRQKLTGIILTLVASTVIIAAYLSYDQRRKNLQEKYIDNLNAMATSKEDAILAFVDRAKADIEYIRKLSVFEEAEEDLFGAEEPAEEEGLDMFGMMMDDDAGMGMDFGGEDEAEVDYATHLLPLKAVLKAEAVIVTKADGSVIYNTNPDSRDNIRKFINNYDREILENAAKGVTFSKVFKSSGKFSIIVGAPVSGSDKRVFLQLSLTDLYASLDADLGIASTYEAVLAQQKGNSAQILNPVKSDTSFALTKFFDLDSTKINNAGTVLAEAVLGREGSGSGYGLDGKQILAAWRHIPEMGWGLTVKIDKAEIDREAFSAVRNFLIYAAIILILAILVSYLLSQYFVTPLLSLKESLASISKGILPEQVDKKHSDEVGEMAATTNELVQGLKRTATFAEQIEVGS